MSAPNHPSSRTTSRLVSVLFIDIASYSTYRNDEQVLLRRELGTQIKALPCLALISVSDVYFDLRAGDSAVIVFTNHLSGPIDAALQLSCAIADDRQGTMSLALRMGVHVGTVTFDESGIAVGEAINMGQRVASSGEVGEITASQTYTDMLEADTNRYDHLLGPSRIVNIKHGRQLMVRAIVEASPSSLPRPTQDEAVPKIPANIQAAFNPPNPRSVTLIITEGAQAGRRILLPPQTVELGRGESPLPSADRLEIAEKTLSRVQGTLVFDAEQATHQFIHNPTATNVTVINNAIRTRHVLCHGDEIRIGQMAIYVSVSPTTRPSQNNVPQLSPTGTLAFNPDSTGKSTFHIAFILRVISGNESDSGKSFPIAESILASRHRLSLGGPGALDNDISLCDPAVANRQAALISDSGLLCIEVEDQSSPVLVNSQRITASHTLTAGDTICVGDTQIRFESTTPEASASAWVSVTSAGFVQRLALRPGTTRIGRLPPCEIVIDDATVSRIHASIHTATDGRCSVRHESATNPTLVNGMTLIGLKTLADGDLIQLSHSTTLRFEQKPGQ